MAKRVKGTQDILDMRRYDLVIKKAYHCFLQANFHHIQTPIIENKDLFVRSVGEQTDIVTKEMYTFATNQKETLCLRPEATASTMRAFIEAKIDNLPWKVFSHGPMFRHERPQKGRWRQFSQFNIEAIGTHDIIQDASFIALLDRFFSQILGIHEYALTINYLGNAHDRQQHRVQLAQYLNAHHDTVCSTCQVRKEKNILRVFDCKNSTCQEVYTNAPLITDYLSPESAEQWELLKNYLHTQSITFSHNPKLVRGLDYYNNTVFEFSSTLLGAQSAFCGGGQYHLAKAMGHKEQLTSIGAAIGIERLLLLLETAEHSLGALSDEPLVGVIALSEEQKKLALLTEQYLQNHGIKSELISSTNLKKAFKRADKRACRLVILIGEEEQQTESVTLKDMVTGDNHRIAHDQILPMIQTLLSQDS